MLAGHCFGRVDLLEIGGGGLDATDGGRIARVNSEVEADDVVLASDGRHILGHSAVGLGVSSVRQVERTNSVGRHVPGSGVLVFDPRHATAKNGPAADGGRSGSERHHVGRVTDKSTVGNFKAAV